MAIGIVSDEDIEKEVESYKDVIKESPAFGRGKQNNVPSGLRKIISETAITEGNESAKALARQFGISDSSVSAYKNGATSTAQYNEPQEDLNLHNKEVKSKASKKAHKTLLSALRHITKDKLEKAKPRDLAGIAKDCSALIKNLEPEQVNDSGVKIVLWAPPLKEEESYTVIDVEE